MVRAGEEEAHRRPGASSHRSGRRAPDRQGVGGVAGWASSRMVALATAKANPAQSSTAS